MGSSSSEHGSISPDSDAQPDAFFEKAQVPKHQLSHLLRYCQCPLSLCRVLVVLQYQNTCWVMERVFVGQQGGQGNTSFSQCPFYSLVVPILLLSPPPPRFPFLLSSSPPPLCLPVLSLFPSHLPSFWSLISLFSSPKDTVEGVKEGRGDTNLLPTHKFLFWSLPQSRTCYPSKTETGIVECVCPQCPR